MCELNRNEQDAVVLQFFENKPLAEIGRKLGLTEEAARKRVSGALERLRAGFGRRRVNVAAGALAAALTGHAIEAAPVGLVATLTGASIAAGGTDASVTSIFIQTLIMKKTTAVVLDLVALGGSCGLATFVWHVRPCPVDLCMVRVRFKFSGQNSKLYTS